MSDLGGGATVAPKTVAAVSSCEEDTPVGLGLPFSSNKKRLLWLSDCQHGVEAT